jgi:hypothetical protein
MITVDLARRLQDTGLGWTPAAGDRFFVPDRDLDDEVFTVSDMVIEVHHLPEGGLFLFNGTTEWALDAIEQADVIWLPREDQLRQLLGRAFVALEATEGGFVVVVDHRGGRERHVDIDAECAYARAVLAVRAARPGS